MKQSLKFVKNKILKIQGKGEQGNGGVDTTLPVAPDSGRMLFDMPTAETSRCDMYGPEVEGSLGMVRNGGISLVDILRQAVAKDLDILPPTAFGDCALEDPADNPFAVREEQNPQEGEKGTTSLVAENSHQVVAMDLDILSPMAAGDCALEDPRTIIQLKIMKILTPKI